MSETYATISVARKELTSELVGKILFTDFSDTSKEAILKALEKRNERHVEFGEPEVPIPNTLLEQYTLYMDHVTDGTISFSGETTADDHMGEDACRILRDHGITYGFTMYYDHDDNNADTTVWSPGQDVFKYDICREGNPTIPFSKIEDAMIAKTDAEKLERIEAVFARYTPYGRKTPESIAKEGLSQIAQIDEILAMLDAGAISQMDALEQIKSVKES